MKLTTVKNHKTSEVIKPISNVFKLKKMIQNAANLNISQNKQNTHTNSQSNFEGQKLDFSKQIKINKRYQLGVQKPQRSKSQVSQQKQIKIHNYKLQLTHINSQKHRINVVSNSTKVNKSIQQYKTTNQVGIIKSSSNKSISTKRIQGLSKSYRCKTNVRQQISIDSFILGKKLGRGRFGNVFVARQKLTNFMLAIKIINKKQLKQAQMEDQLLSQIKLQSYMKHPNILQMYGVFHDHENIYLMLELAEQCLFKDLRRKTCYCQKQVAYFTKQLIEGLKYIHGQNIIHRDLKPENIMIINNVIKIADFGWSVYSPLYKRQTFCGTLDYVPPEIVQGELYDERVDIWSLGVLIYQLAFGYAPFQGNSTEQETFLKIVNGQFEIPEFISQTLAMTIRYILMKDPSSRLNLKDIQDSPWLRMYSKQGRSISEDIWDFWENRRYS